MYPAEFEYFAPATLDEALALLARYGEDAKILAGGQSLLPMMKLRIATPQCLIDVNRIPSLAGLRQVAEAEQASVRAPGAAARSVWLKREN